MNFNGPAIRGLFMLFMAKLSPHGKRAQLTRRATSGAAVSIRSAMQLAYAMAGSFISGMDLDGRLQPTGLSIS